MNLHGIVSPVIGAVNPSIPAVLLISAGYTIAADGTRAPLYATPGSFTGSIAGTVLTISSIASGKPQSGQTLAGAGITAGTSITAQLTGSPGDVGTYSINQAPVAPVASEVITTTCPVRAQVQPMTWRDLQQLDGLNLAGQRVKIYLYGEADSIVRVQSKGGDLITIAEGVNRGTWLIAQTMEQFPDWVSCACTLQNGA